VLSNGSRGPARACLVDCNSLLDETTHPQCSIEGYPDGPGRVLYREGAWWGVIAKLSLELIARSYGMR
jgi:hypothetical protein